MHKLEALEHPKFRKGKLNFNHHWYLTKGLMECQERGAYYCKNVRQDIKHNDNDQAKCNLRICYVGKAKQYCQKVDKKKKCRC